MGPATSHTRLLLADHFPHVDAIVTAVQRTGVPMSAALAMLTLETGGRNVYGHDPVRRGQAYGGTVTHANYIAYKARRRLGWGNQGVGPCQLTGTGYQDQADALGGCWQPLANMRVGFNALRQLYKAHGTWQLTFQHYNGSGPRAIAYGQHADAIMHAWHLRLT